MPKESAGSQEKVQDVQSKGEQSSNASDVTSKTPVPPPDASSLFQNVQIRSLDSKGSQTNRPRSPRR